MNSVSCFDGYEKINRPKITMLLRDVRSATLEQSLRKLGVEKLSKEDVQKMQWESLEGKIGNWIQYMRIAVSEICALPFKAGLTYTVVCV